MTASFNMFPIFLFLLAFPTTSLASLSPVSTTDSTLLSFGSAHTTQAYLLSTNSTEAITSITLDSPSKTSKQILTEYETRHVQIEQGVYNITVDLYFESWVGNLDYAIVVNTENEGRNQTYTHVDTHAVYGMVFYLSDSKKIISGDEHTGLKFSHFLSPDSEGERLSIVTHAPEGVDMTPKLQTRDLFSARSTILPDGSISLKDGGLNIRPTDYTSGAAVIDVICPELEMNGEVFETVIEVSVSDKPPAPAVLMQANGTVDNGQALVEAVVKNSGKDVVLLLEDKELRGEGSDEKYIFVGSGKPGSYKNIRIRNAQGEGVVREGLMLQLVEAENVTMTEIRGEAEAKGRKATIGIFVVAVIIVIAVALIVLVALYWSWRSRKMDAKFIDGRVEHIARDVYGRGSVHV